MHWVIYKSSAHKNVSVTSWDGENDTYLISMALLFRNFPKLRPMFSTSVEETVRDQDDGEIEDDTLRDQGSQRKHNNHTSQDDNDSTSDSDNETVNIHSSEHDIDSHVEYLPHSDRDSHVRRTTVYEKIGTWFPDPISDPDLHAAYILTLFKPWRSVTQLKTDSKPFHKELQCFLTVNPTTQSYVSNIDYYHHCLKSAKQQKSASITTGIQSSTTFENTHSWKDDDTCQITDIDIERARIVHVDQNERYFAQIAINYALGLGMFDTEGVQSPFHPPSQIATANDTVQFQAWHDYLTQVMNAEVNTNAYTGFTPPQYTKTHDAVTSATDISNILPTPIVSTLNQHQKMAHSIIEHHLIADLHNRNPMQLLMQIQGAGGTGKMLLIKAIAETFHTHNVYPALGLTATSGIAATLFGGSTIHSWGGVTATSSIDNPS
ncbi:hypothetical protein IW262DRAFT_1296857 [Armillaria fumosa]|nr:hypothetical protein IW262DRAFT_1296857 [Armillaria fumosa]